jgi:hypothetical protein
MGNHVLVWDLETMPDLAAVARVHGLVETNDMEARSALGDKFLKPPLHKTPVSAHSSPNAPGLGGRSSRLVRPQR